MATPSNQQFSFVTITKTDLEKGDPTRLNQALRFIAEQLAATQGGQGPFTFKAGPFTFNGKVTVNGGLVVVLPKFSGNQAAKAGGLVVGQLYQSTGSSVGQVMVVY
jgi:hypothetical protein